MSEFNIEDIIKEAAVAYQPSSEMRFVEIVRRGITKKSLMRLAELSSLSLKQLSGLLPVSYRTLQRYNNDDLLDSAVSEHALLIAEVLSKASNIFETTESMQKWLHTPTVGLGHKTPLSLLDTSFGIRIVANELGRLEYGVYS